MSKVSLRTYNREIASLIDQGQRLDEAIAHCHHILTTYSKHLNTYRLLGKAYLEARRHDEAADVFQRVLVASPEDFVSHVGMSIISDDHGKLDQAIWHMERAFEIQPSNAAIQAELQRLFGRRDGIEPPRIRLTRGALARMYMQGQLYTQAISEIRAVLTHDPDRTDMLVLLAWAHFRSGQKSQAAEVCSSLLALSPYCQDANRLMAEIAPDMQVPEVMGGYRRRVIQLDPYAEFVDGSLLATDEVPDDAIMLQRLEYSGQPSDAGSSRALGLAATLGAEDLSDSAPAWLTSTAEAGTPSEEDLPAFMRKSAWRLATETPRQAPPPEDTGALDSAPLPGDLPEWVQALARTEERELGSSISEASHDGSDGSAQAGDLGLGDSFAEQGSAIVDVTPDWLAEANAGSDRSIASRGGPELAQGAEHAESIHQGQDEADFVSMAEEGAGDLASLQEPAANHNPEDEALLMAPESLPAAPSSRIEELGHPTPPTYPSWESPGDVPDDAGEFGTNSDAAPRQAPAANPLEWLTALTDQDDTAGAETPIASERPSIMEGRETTPWSPTSRRTDGEPPEWLEGRPGMPTKPASPIARETAGEFESAVELPDWLADLDDEKQASSPSSRDQGPTEHDPDWLRAGTTNTRGIMGRTSAWQRADQILEPNPNLDETRDTEKDAAAAPVSEIPGVTVQPLREPIPLGIRTVADTSALAAPSLGGARAELGRGNIAAALDTYARLIRKGKSLEEIIRDLRDALHRHPVEVSIWQALGDAYIRANRLQEALDAYTRAEELLR